jgi:iron complex outermembrane receptor protein
VFGIRGALMSQRHTHEYGDTAERDSHQTGFGEASLTGTAGKHTWVVGGAAQIDRYRSQAVSRYDYTFVVPSVFVQDDFTMGELAISASARLDHHNRYGVFLSPRVSALFRFGSAWTARASAGAGYYAPTPLTEETEAAGLSNLVSADLSKAERARTYSVDISREMGPLNVSATVFGSRVTDALATRPAAGMSIGYELVPLKGPTRVNGAELLAASHFGEFAVVTTYTFVDATEPDAVTSTRVTTPYTPRHTAGIVVMWEREEAGRAGLETYYTGRQALDENPYRATSVPYVYFGALAERQWGRLRIFVNAENLTNRRQTRVDPLVRPARHYDGRWTVDAWAPLDGFVMNAGFRVQF